MKKLMLFAALLALPASGMAQTDNETVIAEDPTYDLAYPLDSRAAGVSLAVRAADGSAVLFQDRVRVEGANSLQLLFAEAQLGNTGFLRIRSLRDGDTQQMSAAQLAEWSNHSAFFNGDEVEISLHATTPEPGLFFRLEAVRAEDGNLITPASICGPVDDRRLSQDKRVGRAAPTGCTAWIIENGALLTAGHCVASNRLNVVEFNVPPSTPAGAKVRAAARDQFPVTIGTNTNLGIGNDYSVLTAGRNSAGQTPIQAQGSAFRVSTSANARDITVTGFGTASGVRNAAQTTHTGGYQGQTARSASNIAHFYTTDTTGGDSGSPIITESGTAIGIHTNGGCSANGGRNSGTSFNNPVLLRAIRAAGQITVAQ
jgi:V8-like Glu-specific endopeptidase